MPRGRAAKENSAGGKLVVHDAVFHDAVVTVSKAHGCTMSDVVRSPELIAEVHATIAGRAPEKKDAPWLDAEGKPYGFLDFVEQVLTECPPLTKAQRAIARVAFQGEHPEEIADEFERKFALDLFGGMRRIPDEAADTDLLVLRLGRWSGKTTLCSTRALHRMCTADLSRCGPGDKPRVMLVAPTGETAKIALGVVRGLAESEAIRPMIWGDSQEGFSLRRPDGREVICMVVRKSRGGACVRGASILDLILDESEFVTTGVDAAVQDTDLIAAATPRILPGGRVMLISTPSAGPSETARLFAANFGKPDTALAARATTLAMRDNDPIIRRKYEKDAKRDYAKARQEYFCELTDGAGGAFFPISAIERAMREPPAPAEKRKASFGFDPAFVNDSSALVGVERRLTDPKRPTLDVVHHETVSPQPQSPLVPSEVVKNFCATVRAHGTRALATDQHKYGIVAHNAAACGVQTAQGPHFNETMVYLREVMLDGLIRLPDDPALFEQLKSITYRAKSGGGIHVEAPRGATGHADLVAALAMAVWFDSRQFGPLVKGEPRSGSSGGESPAREERVLGRR